jgi:hypothetical protein
MYIFWGAFALFVAWILWLVYRALKVPNSTTQADSFDVLDFQNNLNTLEAKHKQKHGAN